LYDRPTGLLMHDPSGRMCVNMVLKADRKPFATYTKGLLGAPQPKKKPPLFVSYLAYFGTYTIDAKAGTVAHHLEDSLVPGRRGADNIRWFAFQGDDGVLLTPNRRWQRRRARSQRRHLQTSLGAHQVALRRREK
jgi:hypothetical protein